MSEYIFTGSVLPPYMAFPRFLMEMKLNDTARIVYMLLLDRCRISQKNGDWCNESGAVFIIYPIAKLAEALHRSEMTIKTALASLEKVGLIRRERTGVGRPNRIYVLIPTEKILSMRSKENRLSEGQDFFCQADRKLSGSNNKISNNQRNNKEGDSRYSVYGEYRNVFLSESEMEDLAETVPDYPDYIERLSAYMASTGKQYRNHAATIKSWARQDREKAQPKKPAYSHEMYTFKEGDSL